MNQTHDVATDQRVIALAQVNQMHDDLIDANKTISQLKADLNRERDRVALIFEERDRYRHEALRLRKLLIELTTQMANIGLLTRKAEEHISTINEIDDAPTPSTEAIDKLEAEYGGKPEQLS
jgi:hypothetical protein